MNTTENIAPARRIIGSFVKQTWGGRRGDSAIYAGEEKFDATAAVLLLPHKALIALKDSDPTTDEIGQAHVQWDGPCEVSLVYSIQEFFGVESLSDVTPEALENARELANPQEAKEQTLTLTIKVVVRAIEGADINEFIENLDYSVVSKTAGVVVTDTEIIDSDDLPTVARQVPRG